MLPKDYEIPENLSQQYLYDLLSCFAVPDSAYFDSFPVTNREAAECWFNATWSYFMCLSSPPAVSLIEESEDLFRGIFITKFAQMSIAKSGQLKIFASCFSGFASQVSTLFSEIYTTNSVVMPSQLETEFESVGTIGMSGGSGETCIRLLSGYIHTFFVGHTSTLIAEPYTVFPWL